MPLSGIGTEVITTFGMLFLDERVGESEGLQARLRVGNICGLVVRTNQNTEKIGL